MYRIADIQTALLHLIGWRQFYNTQEFRINDGLTQSTSGQYFQDFHPMITLENLKAVAPGFDRISHPNWDEATQYFTGDKVKVDGYDFRALQDSLGEEPVPGEDTEFWEITDGLSDWVEEKTKAAIAKTVRRFWTEKLKDKTAKNIIENKSLFDGAGRISDLITETGNWVGLELVPLRAEGVTLQLGKIGLQFKGTGDVTLYLMHSSQKQPVKTITCSVTKDSSFQWFTQEDLFLSYRGEDTESGGSWYLIYDQDALPEGMQAINKDRDWSKDPCHSCNSYDSRVWQTFSKFLEVHPFKVNRAETVELWDVADNLYTYTKNYGINLQLTLSCDVTDLIIEHKNSFQNAIGLQMAEMMMQEFLFNPAYRIGRTQQNFSSQEIRYELEGNPQSFRKSGVSYELTKAIDALKIDTTNLSRICFPCNNGGVKYRTV